MTDRPLAASPSRVTRRITEEQVEVLRETRDNMDECVKVLRRNLETFDDCLAAINTQVVTERTTETE